MGNMKEDKGKLIVISGGGTGGPSTAPLALASAYSVLDPKARFLFIGNDPVLEKKLFDEALKMLGAEYISLPAGKWRRYFSVKNFFDFFRIITAFCRVLILFYKKRPDLIISAGSFASVPVAWAGRLTGAKILIHQQDLRPGLANRLMAPAANKLTVTFEKSLKDYGDRAMLIGNPSVAGRLTEETKRKVATRFGLSGRPLLFVTGGGSGATGLNRLFYSALPFLPSDWDIIHISGRGKGLDAPSRANYQVTENLAHEDFSALLSLADIVITRAGLGVLTELSIAAKPSILVPMPNSHQEDNAEYFKSQNAALVFHEKENNGEDFSRLILDLFKHEGQRMKLSANIAMIMPPDAAVRGAEIIKEMLD